MKFVLYLLIVFLSLVTFTQKPTVGLSADSKNVLIGDQVSFTVKSNISGEVNIDFPKEFNVGYGTMNGMEQEVNYNTGQVVTIYHFSQSGSFTKEGEYSFYAYVTKNNKAYRSNSITIKVEKEKNNNKQKLDEEISKRNLQQSIFGIIQKSKSKFYEGEAVVLQAKVYSKLNINMLEGYQSFEVEGGAESKEIEKTTRLLMNRENINGQNYLTFNYGKMVVYPAMTGKLRIKPFEMTLQYDNGGIFSDQLNFISNANLIEVMPLPNNAPNDFVGAVGTFDLEQEIEKKNLKKGDVFKVKLILSGIGNLHNTDKLNLKLPKGISLYGDPEVKEKIKFTENGAEGKIVYTFHLQINKNGIIELPAFTCSYFDPSKKKYIQIKKNKVVIDVEGYDNDNEIERFSEVNEKNHSKETASQLSIVDKQKQDSFYNSPLFWPSVVSPLFLAFLFIFFYKKSKNPIEKTEKINTKIEFEKLQNQLKDIENSIETKSSNELIRAIEQLLKSTSFLFDKESSINTKGELLQLFEINKVNSEVIKECEQLFILCEEIKYNPTSQIANTKLIEVTKQFLNTFRDKTSDL
jgi:hypothetical protein